MRHAEREITDLAEIEEIIKKAEVCRLGMVDDGEPYIVPMNFGYRKSVLYFHCAKEGKKLDVLRRNPQVCFELEGEARLVPGETACRWSSSFRSVIGWGKAMIVLDEAGVKEGLMVIMDHYTPGTNDFDPRSLSLTAMIRVDVERMTGKRSKW
ncbi:MAG: pyridoxamine 5'-phosphate oxidase family protein [Methanomassiliicoccales archaeon]|nr:pyridoxamine 5'-phosphate oxidase family protein [Methanomassiliicoccales archaeon]